MRSSHIWYPCTQMKDLVQFPPIKIQAAKGSYLYLEDGTKVIDANSSWWCKNLGHGHPRLQEALIDQAKQFEHVIAANTKNSVLETLAQKLGTLIPGISKVCFASDGSCAVEMAIKMSLHAQQIQGHTKRRQFMSLSNGFHGETGLALAVTEIPIYRAPYAPMLMDVNFITNIPYVETVLDPVWSDCSAYWPVIEQQLEQQADSLAGIIVEPIVQAAGGMLIYSQDFLVRLNQFAKRHGIHLILDEIFTGFGRTGLPFACEHANISPDFICIGKGLTGGWLPMSAMLTTQEVYDLFYVDYDPNRTFFHSHTYSGNALAAAVAIATLQTLQDENIYEHVQERSHTWFEHMAEVAESTGRLERIRYIGGVIAADIIGDDRQRLGFNVFQEAVKLGALLRPLGNTLYWSPPLNTPPEVMTALRDITITAIRNTFEH